MPSKTTSVYTFKVALAGRKSIWRRIAGGGKVGVLCSRSLGLNAVPACRSNQRRAGARSSPLASGEVNPYRLAGGGGLLAPMAQRVTSRQPPVIGPGRRGNTLMATLLEAVSCPEVDLFQARGRFTS